MNLPVNVKRAILIPDMKELKIKRDNGRLLVKVPKFSCHCAIAFEYE